MSDSYCGMMTATKIMMDEVNWAKSRVTDVINIANDPDKVRETLLAMISLEKDVRTKASEDLDVFFEDVDEDLVTTISELLCDGDENKRVCITAEAYIRQLTDI